MDPDLEGSRRIEIEERGPFPTDEPSSTRRGATSFTYSRVLTDDETVIEQDLASIGFEDLAIGDRVTVTGKSDGDEVEASRVVRRRRVGQ